MSSKALELVKEAEAFLAFDNKGCESAAVNGAFSCPKCDPDVGYFCEYCQAIDMIQRLTKQLKATSMSDKRRTKLSKFLSFILRHNPGSIGLNLDSNGWAGIYDLIIKARQNNTNISLEDIEYIAATCNKQRFEFSDDKKKIRACQGHSINIDLDLKPVSPPDILYHGTAEKTVPYIKNSGIIKMNRDHVHLSQDFVTATNVGNRHGKPTVLHIDAKKMNEHGMTFYLSTNGVWLTDFVPKEYIIFAK